jgi:pimeloyl-ACP methyl ester carboxylesterase
MTVMTAETAGFTEHRVGADGFKIRYWESGQGAPLAVVHGAGGPQINGGLPLELLARDRRVIAFELPGFGDSEPNRRTEDGRQMAATLAAAMDALGIETYSITGTSMGGIVCLWWAVDFPQHVTSVVLEAPSAFRCCYERPDNLMTDRDAFIRAFHGRPDRKPWLAGFQPSVPPNWDLVGRIMGPDRDDVLEERLPEIQVPVLVLHGTKDGVISPSEDRHYKELIPDCYVMLVYGAAHDLKGDRPEAYAQVVGDFLSYGPNFLVNHRSTVINP